MISRIPARRRAEDFAARVDTRSADRGTLHDAAAHSDDRLLALVGALRSAEAPAPRPEFVSDLRERLMTEAADVLSPTTARLALPPRTRGARERRIVAAASVAVLLGGSASMAAAAQDALPGEALYPIKRGLEQAGTTLLSEEAKGSRLLEQAAGRLDEVARLAAVRGPALEDQVAETVADFTDQARAGAALLFASYEQTGDAGDVSQVREFAAASLETFAVLAPQLPPSSDSQLSAAAVALQILDATAAQLCAGCGPASVVDLPTELLAYAEAGRALDASREAADALDNDHPVALDKGLGLPVLPGSEPTASAAPAPEQPGPSAGSTPTRPGRLTSDDDLTELVPALLDILRGVAESQGSTSGPDTPKAPKPTATAGQQDDEEPGLRDVTDPLVDLVGTLLPDPDKKLLPRPADR